MPKYFHINIFKKRKFTVTNTNILKCNSLHYALNHFFRVFQFVNPKIKIQHKKPCVVFQNPI